MPKYFCFEKGECPLPETKEDISWATASLVDNLESRVDVADLWSDMRPVLVDNLRRLCVTVPAKCKVIPSSFLGFLAMVENECGRREIAFSLICTKSSLLWSKLVCTRMNRLLDIKHSSH